MTRCAALLSKDFLRSTDRTREPRCRREAAFEIASSPLCNEHAALVLLEHAKKAGTIKTLSPK